MSEAGCEVSTAGNAEEAPARLVDLSPDLGLCVPSLPSDPLTRDQPEWGRRVDRHPLGIAIRRSRSGASRVLALKTKRNLRFSVPEEEGGTLVITAERDRIDSEALSERFRSLFG